MKNYATKRNSLIKSASLLWIVLLMFIPRQISAQVISNNGAVISVPNGSLLEAATIENNSGTIENNGTLTAGTLTNGGTLQGDGIYFISSVFTNTGIFAIGTSTVNFNGSGAQTIPAYDYYNCTSSSTGNRTLANSGTIGVAGTFTPGTNSYTTAGSTIEFNGTSAQTVAPFTYYNLSFSNSGTKTISGTVTVNNDVVINSGATLIVDVGGILAVHNNIDNDGTFNNDGTLTYAP